MCTLGAPAATSDSCGGMMRHRPAMLERRGGHSFPEAAWRLNSWCFLQAAGKIVASSVAMPAPQVVMQSVAWTR